VASVDVELARQHWEEGNRRFEAIRERDSNLYQALVRLAGIVTGELRARVGQVFTMAELVAAYLRAEDWGRQVIADSEPPSGWPSHVSSVVDAAFREYARGATDYEP
jgi:hypothetical protein